jgi:putative glycosyltransferase (TIGR04372 family)
MLNTIIRKIRVLIRHILDGIFFILLLPYSLLALLIIRSLTPFILIRLGWIVSWRIGHYAGNLDMYLCERSNNFVKTLDIWCERTPTCNTQLTIVFKRVINILPKFLVYPVYILNNFIPGGDKHNIPLPACNDRDVNNLISDVCSSSNVWLTKDEEEKGRKELIKLGINPEDKFVCLIVRDSAYLEKQKKENHSGVDWSYHDYRDTEIDDYTLAAQYLVEQGYFVIRMGATVNKPFACASGKIIDYAYENMRTDFMDIYLGLKCHFCISTSTGYDAIPSLFRRPLVIVNNPHIEYIYSFFPKTITIFKKVFNIETKEYLSIKNILENGVGRFDRTNQFIESKLKLIDNTPEEIRDAVIEMVLRLDKEWLDDWYDENVKGRIDQFYSTSQLNGRILSRFGTKFLKENIYLISK